MECTNCKSTSWAAKNDSYCTDCERDWWAVFKMTVSDEPNPGQKWADEILAKYGK